ncbi:uncharacterized protein N7482_000151 [Penicillium canariense]|uniref:Initiation-specific alpha-1,6-mannosyltransferase n=1 Tax=Penicillium canariense TaxID=189055 RepID=A0A9W9LSN8_9EURO|nr:uncharacterized protein N7482_000151 [Penicillium canariense]KAJ5174274.1 hypothetical protein N7482_000151 [Penicillium canariense]
MLSVSTLMTARSFRLVLAAIISLFFFHALYVWDPLDWALHDVSTGRAQSFETTTNSDAGAASKIPLKTVGTSELKTHSLIPDTAIRHIPDKVWHSAKDNHVTDTQRTWIDSWTDKNPSHREELLTDSSGEAFVQAYYQQTRPDIVEVYKAIPIPILRADLLRYLIVLAEGGIWSDLDVTCENPVVNWVPPEYKDQDIDMIVGLEFDFDWRGPGTEVASQFCNWAFAARPSSRNLQVVVDSVIKVLTDIARTNGVQISGITLEMLSDVVNVTGPKIMTIALLESLGQLLGREVDDRDFSGIKHPKLVGDLLIMPGVSFAAGQNRYPKDQGDALVTHHYEGSWKQADAEAKERKKQNQHP